MNKKLERRSENQITVSAEKLAGMLDCGRATAVKIGNAAGARIQIGQRVMYRVSSIEKYLDEQAKVQGMR